jgi:polyisoprenoid-binding protein YceI
VKFAIAFACTAALLLTAATAYPGEPRWISRASGSELAFSAWYEGEELPGRFERFEARLAVDESSGDPQALTVEVDVGSVDMNDRQINEELSEPEWFDAATFPQAAFSSDAIRRVGQAYLAAGQLRIKGIEKPLEIPLEWRRDGDSATLSGAVTLMRRDWQVGSGEWASDASLADRVELRYRVTLTPAR